MAALCEIDTAMNQVHYYYYWCGIMLALCWHYVGLEIISGDIPPPTYGGSKACLHITSTNHEIHRNCQYFCLFNIHILKIPSTSPIIEGPHPTLTPTPTYPDLILLTKLSYQLCKQEIFINFLTLKIRFLMIFYVFGQISLQTTLAKI